VQVFCEKKKWVEEVEQPIFYHNLFDLLKISFILKKEDVMKKCLEFLEKNFTLCYGHPDLLRLPFPVLLAFLSHRSPPTEEPRLVTFGSEDLLAEYLFCWYATQREDGVEEFILKKQMRQLFKRIQLKFVKLGKKFDVIRPKDWVSSEELWDSSEVAWQMFMDYTNFQDLTLQ